MWDNVNKKTLFSTGIQTELACKIIEFAHEGKLLSFVYCGEEVFTEEVTEFSAFYADTCKVKVNAVGDLGEFVKNNKIVTPKVMLAGYPPDQIETSLKKSLGNFGKDCEIAESYKGMLDFMPKGCDKGLAVKALADIWGIKPEECVATGDSTTRLCLKPRGSALR